MGKEQNKTLKCADCGHDFVFPAGEQRFFKERGFSQPKRCPRCRARKREEKGRG